MRVEVYTHHEQRADLRKLSRPPERLRKDRARSRSRSCGSVAAVQSYASTRLRAEKASRVLLCLDVHGYHALQESYFCAFQSGSTVSSLGV